MGGFEVVDPRYEPLFERTRAVLTGDSRVVDVVLRGSIADGTADAWSDLDVQVVAHQDAYRDFLADWPTWLASITPTVFARTPIAPFVLNTVTADGLTFDLAIYDRPPPPFAPTKYSVGLLSREQFDDLGTALDYAVAEQLRGMNGPFISLLQRDEHLRHMTGLPHIIGLLTTVFVAELDAPPLSKRWNDTFTDEQLATVAALPPMSATREGVLGFGMAVAELVVTRARPLYPRYGLTWPTELAQVTAARVRDAVGIDTSAWLY